MQTNTPNPRLLEAAIKGHTETIRTLLESKETDVNACDSEGMTALHFASKNGHIKIVKRLLANGAEVNAENNYGFTPIALAAKECYVDVAKAL
jgi:ankyrin repeat protein